MVDRRVVEIWVGVFVLLGGLALAMLAFMVGNVRVTELFGAQEYQITAQFDNIGGLKVKAPVTLAGVRIGRVSSIYVDQQDFRAVVEMTISNSYNNLPTDTTAIILTSGVLGEQYIGIEPGGEETFLKNGDQIILTQSALVLENLIGQFLYSAGGDGDTDGISKLAGTLERLIERLFEEESKKGAK